MKALAPAVDYELRSLERSKSIRITVRRDGSVLVTKPRRVSPKAAEAFAKKSMPWILKARERFSKMPRPKSRSAKERRQEYLRLKESARELVIGRLRYYAFAYGVAPQKIFIRDQKSRWGSCSKAGNLSFNYRLAHLPKPLLDYVVVHELCHLLQFDHSARFWELVAREIPRYKEARQKLRHYERFLV